ncbi:MAG: lipid A biosynthesis protein [Rhodobacteraceae bacterium PARR1]|nr:MAG: lipid A biosynthesis protein [Rhodobacteraceae bacterium PARR1]
MIHALQDFFARTTEIELIWLVIGFSAQGLFSARFLVQLIASERQRQSVVPETFWYLSLLGGVMLLAYAIHRADPVIALGQMFGIVVYARNIWFLSRKD